MWNWFNCYLSGRHEYGVWCEPGAIFLRCVHCGKRSSGWAVSQKAQATAPRMKAPRPVTPAPIASSRPGPTRVLPFDRAAAR
ncbi:MAG: hypothetical protein ACM3SQ_12635 [Betaproteobacteria bacterium]